MPSSADFVLLPRASPYAYSCSLADMGAKNVEHGLTQIRGILRQIEQSAGAAHAHGFRSISQVLNGIFQTLLPSAFLDVLVRELHIRRSRTCCDTLRHGSILRQAQGFSPHLSSLSLSKRTPLSPRCLTVRILLYGIPFYFYHFYGHSRRSCGYFVIPAKAGIQGYTSSLKNVTLHAPAFFLPSPPDQIRPTALPQPVAASFLTPS